MLKIVATFILLCVMDTLVLYDFSKTTNVQDWYLLNDDVMGGISQSTFVLTAQGNAIFSGKVSLENNGGFASVHHRFTSLDLGEATQLLIYVKGDGKRYQARIYPATNEYFSYVAYFETNGDWQIIEIPLNKMYPSYRGRKLDRPNYPGTEINEFAILIGNKKEENFSLQIRKIEFR